MLRARTAILAILVCTFGFGVVQQAGATTLGCNNSGSVHCRAVIDSIDTLQGSTNYNDDVYQYITVTCYHSASPTSICAGGGDFDRVLKGVGTCDGTDVDNGATIILDQHKSGNCFYRKNFGTNGTVDARQCGVYGDGSNDDRAALNTCLALANTMKLGVVATGGGIVRIIDNNISVPRNVILSCGGINQVAEPDGDYRIGPNLTNAIVINPLQTIRLNDENSGITGCTVEAGPENSNTYSPAIWYPDCLPASSPCSTDMTPKQYLRSSLLEQSAFTTWPGSGLSPPAGASVGVTISDGHASVSNVTFLGFGTCISVTGAPNPSLERVYGDCSQGLVINTSDVPHVNGASFDSFLTGKEEAFKIEDSSIMWNGSAYAVTADLTGDPFFTLQNGDLVWIAPQPGDGAESANGYWVIDGLAGGTCSNTDCTFTLTGSVNMITENPTTSPNIQINNVMANGVPPTAITGLNPTDPALKFIQVGQTVEDSTDGSCFPTSPKPKVTAVWPAVGIVYVSDPSSCSHAGTDTIVFRDRGYSGAKGDCVLDNHSEVPPPPGSDTGCMIIDPNFRWGDGIFVDNSGGTAVLNCHVYEHLVSFHLYDGARTSQFTNCATGNANDLPDRNLAAHIQPGYLSGNIISVLIDGSNDHGDTGQTDACESNWVNDLLGQHRGVNIVVQSDCNASNKFANVSVGGGAGGIDVELDAGAVSMVNAAGFGNSSVLKAHQADLFSYNGSEFAKEGTYPATLDISNNRLENVSLIIEDNDAVKSTTGCGNTFGNSANYSEPNPYVCTPPAGNLLPGGRLALPAGSGGSCTSTPPTPVMKLDAVGAKCVFYLPYRSQTVPIYNPSAVGFGVVDIGTAGLQLNLDPSSGHKQLSGKIYDIFVETVNTGSPELCVGTQWMSDGVTRTVDIQRVQGIWVNKVAITNCQYDVSSNVKCPIFQCTYLGTMYMTADGQTTQQFGPDSNPHGNSNCLCLYNAYNRVPIVSVSLDSGATYSYSVALWRTMNPSGVGGLNGNYIRFVDGLGESAIDARLNDLVKANNANPLIGMVLNAITGAPAYYSSTTSASSISVSAPLQNPPLLGFWYVQAMESASTTVPGGPSFGGPSRQQISLNIDD